LPQRAETGAHVNSAPIAPTVIKYFGQCFGSPCPNLVLFFLRFFFAFFFDLSLIGAQPPQGANV